MILPRFTVQQDDEFVQLEIKCPHIKSQEVDFVVDGSHFQFHVRPYFLSLHFPGRLVENGREKASYDLGQGLLSIRLPKEQPGEHFPDLNLMTQLMTRKKEPTAQKSHGPLVEVIASSSSSSHGDEHTHATDTMHPNGDNDDDDDNDNDNDVALEEAMRDHFESLCFREPVPDQDQQDLAAVSTACRYGFNQQHAGYFVGFEELDGIHEMLDMGNPEVHLRHESVDERRKRQRALQDAFFDEDRYIADFMDTEVIDGICAWTPWWQEESVLCRMLEKSAVLAAGSHGVTTTTTTKMDGLALDFTEKEQALMMTLPKKEYVFENASTLRSHYLSLVTILYAGAYNHRTNTGDNSVESAWLLVKLCPTLSWFLHPRSLADAVESVLRASFCFPLYRSWELSVRCLRDTSELLLMGKQAVTKMLLDVLDILAHHEDAWRLGKIWLEDFASWVQTGAREQLLVSLGVDLQNMLEQHEQQERERDQSSSSGEPLIGLPSKSSFHIGDWNLEILEKIAMDCSDSEGGAGGVERWGLGVGDQGELDDNDQDTDTTHTDDSSSDGDDDEDSDMDSLTSGSEWNSSSDGSSLESLTENMIHIPGMSANKANSLLEGTLTISNNDSSNLAASYDDANDDDGDADATHEPKRPLIQMLD